MRCAEASVGGGSGVRVADGSPGTEGETRWVKVEAPLLGSADPWRHGGVNLVGGDT